MPPNVEDLFDYAYVGDLQAKLKWLADLAAPEKWDHPQSPATRDKPNPLLLNYLRYTFKRLCEEGKVAEPSDSACFNTGLVTPLQEEIFAFLVPNEHEDREKWFLVGFYPESDRRLLGFSHLPERAQYFDDPSELLYDFRRSLRKNLTHIIDQNRERFPETYASEADTHRLRIALEGAINHALRRIRLNYKTAVPQYYWAHGTGKGQLQLLLPLCMTSLPEFSMTCIGPWLPVMVTLIVLGDGAIAFGAHSLLKDRARSVQR